MGLMKKAGAKKKARKSKKDKPGEVKAGGGGRHSESYRQQLITECGDEARVKHCRNQGWYIE